MKKLLLTFTAVALISIGIPASATASVKIVDQAICETEVLDAQQNWCKALIDISTTYAKNGHSEAKALAEQIIDQAYGYQMGTVLFKPTLTTEPQTFRTTSRGALSYFVGGDQKFPDDSGFALKGWTKCEPENAAIFIAGNTASTMGKVHFTDVDGNVTTVDKTWVFFKDDSGQIRIMVHHSSLEYDGQ